MSYNAAIGLEKVTEEAGSTEKELALTDRIGTDTDKGLNSTEKGLALTYGTDNTE